MVILTGFHCDKNDDKDDNKHHSRVKEDDDSNDDNDSAKKKNTKIEIMTMTAKITMKTLTIMMTIQQRKQERTAMMTMKKT